MSVKIARIGAECQIELRSGANAVEERIKFLSQLGKKKLGALFDKRGVVEDSLNLLYSQTHCKERMYFVLTCSKTYGGYGDFFNLIKTAKILEQNFCGCKVDLVAPDKPSYEKLSKLCGEEFRRSLKLAQHAVPWQKQLGGPWTAAYGLDVACPDTKNCIPHLPPDHDHIDEYNGWRYSKAIHGKRKPLCKEWYSAGVGIVAPKMAPAIGMHLVDRLPEADLPPWQHLENIGNSLLKQTILGSHTAKEYSEKSRLYFGYHSLSGDVRTEYYLYRFLDPIVAFESQKTDNFGADILIIYPFTYITERMELEIRIIFGNLQSIASFYAKKRINWECLFTDTNAGVLQKKEVRPSSLRGGSRTIRFIISGGVKHEDMWRLFQVSERLTYTSGDQSLAETISVRNKVIFYQIQPWKKDLIEQIVDIARDQFGADSELIKFMKEVYTPQENIRMNENRLQWSKPEMRATRRIVKLLSCTQLYSQFAQLSDVLKRFYTIDSWITGKIKRRIALNNDPSLRKVEKRVLMASKTHRKEALEDAAQEIKERLEGQPQPKKRRG